MEQTKKIVVITDSELSALIKEATEKGVLEGLDKGVKMQLQRDEWLTVKEAAVLLKIKPPTLRTWISEGRIRYHYKGKKLLLKRSEVMSTDPHNLPPAKY